MKIMFYTSSMGKGGAERVISVLSNKLVEENEIYIVINTKNNMAYELNEKIKILELDKKYNKLNIYRNINRILITKKIIDIENPDIIISFLPMPSFRILMLKNKKIPIIISDRNDPKQEYKSVISKIMMKLLYKKADGFVFQTNEQKEYFDEKIQNKSVIIPNPIKDEFIQDSNDNVKKEKLIITVGRLVEQKNQQMLISAFSKISDKYKEYNLKIFGDGPLKDILQEQINTLNMKERIFLCGVSDNIKKELERAEIFVLPSNYEGMPNALIEAMAVGLPCISTDCPCGGPRELIKNKENGLLLPVNSESKLVEAIRELIDNNEYSQKLGNNAKKIKEELKIDFIINKWKEYYLKIYKENKNERK